MTYWWGVVSRRRCKLGTQIFGGDMRGRLGAHIKLFTLSPYSLWRSVIPHAVHHCTFRSVIELPSIFSFAILAALCELPSSNYLSAYI